MKYIQPRLYIASSYESLLELKSRGNYFFDYDDDTTSARLSDILENRVTFIVAEPGQGKTRLIEELEGLYENARRIDFKTKLPGQDIDSWLRLNSIHDDTDIILLDGLDESPNRDIIETIRGLVYHINGHPKCRYVISSRIHYFSKYQNIFRGIPDAHYLFINPLEFHEAEKFLEQIGVKTSVVRTLFNSLPYGHTGDSSILQNPRYLEIIAKKLEDENFNAEDLNRPMLFASLVSKQLLGEDEKSGRQLAELKQRFLEHIALTMKIAQVTEISTDDFITFIDKASSDVKLLLGNTDIEDIYEHALLTKNVEGRIYFTNAEIQEYLAAKYIARMANPIRKAFTLAFDSQTRRLIPSWRNTLSYLVDEMPEMARLIIDLQSEDATLNDDTELLVTGVNAVCMTSSDKEYIFDRIWSQHKRQSTFIDREVLFNLARYASSGQIESVLEFVISKHNTKANHAMLLNAIVFCGEALLLNRYNKEDNQRLVERLLTIACRRVKDNKYDLQYNAIHSLMATNDESVLNRLLSSAHRNYTVIFDAIQSFAYKMDRNSEVAIDIYIEGMKREVIGSQFYIEKLDKPESIGYFLRKLAIDENLVLSVINRDKLALNGKSKFLASIDKLWHDDWLSRLKQFVYLSSKVEYGYYAEHSEFVQKIINLISQKDLSYFDEILEYSLHGGKDGDTFLYRMRSSLARKMTIDAVDKIVRLMAEGDQGRLLWNLLTEVIGSDNPNKVTIEKRARTLLPKEFKQFDAEMRRMQRQDKLNQPTVKFNTIYKQICNDLKDGSLGSLYDAAKMIVDYLEDANRREELNYTEEQVACIWEGLKKHILDDFNESRIQFAYTKKYPGGGGEYTISTCVSQAIKAVLFGYLTKRTDLEVYKQKILSLFPYMYEEQRHDIFDNIKLDDADKANIIESYKDVDTDKAQHLPENFIEFADKYSVKEAVPILRDFILKSDIMVHYKVKALRVAEVIMPDKKFLLKVLGYYQKNHDDLSRLILQEVDSILIANYEDEGAIIRRAQLLKNKAFNCPRHPSGAFYSISDDEAELDDKVIAKPLAGLTNSKWIDLFTDLLRESFEINGRGEGWSRYAFYLWRVCESYFKNLSYTKDIGIVRLIEEEVEKHPEHMTAGFRRLLKDIKASFLEQLGGKHSYSMAIQLVNQFNSTDDRAICSEDELLFEAEEIIRSLDRWVKQEGSSLLCNGEVDAQRNIAIRFENLLLEKYNKSDIHTRFEREVQELDGTRTDFQVYHGFFGPVIIELKLSTHSELYGRTSLKKTKSFDSMKKYMLQFNAKNGILLIYKHQSTEDETFEKILHNTRKYYEEIPGVKVMTIGG